MKEVYYINMYMWFCCMSEIAKQLGEQFSPVMRSTMISA